jgi:hypothetical protein
MTHSSFYAMYSTLNYVTGLNAVSEILFLTNLLHIIKKVYQITLFFTTYYNSHTRSILNLVKCCIQCNMKITYHVTSWSIYAFVSYRKLTRAKILKVTEVQEHHFLRDWQIVFYKSVFCSHKDTHTHRPLLLWTMLPENSV